MELDQSEQDNLMSRSRSLVAAGLIVAVLVIALIISYSSGVIRTTENRQQNDQVPLVPAVKEPDRIFTWKRTDDENIAVKLIDHSAGTVVKEAVLITDLPLGSLLESAYGRGIHYQGPSETILFEVKNRSEYDGSVIDPTLNFCNAIYAANFTNTDPRVVWSESECTLLSWTVNPLDGELYVSTANESPSLLVIDINSSQVIEHLRLSQARPEFKLSALGDKLGFVDWLGNVHFEGELQSFIEIQKDDSHPKIGSGDNNIFVRESFESFRHADSAQNLSPTFRFFPYGFGYFDLESGEKFSIDLFNGENMKNYSIEWSGDESKLLFVTEAGLSAYDRVNNSREYIPLTERADSLQWAPSQRYILFSSYSQGVLVWDTKTDQFDAFEADFQPSGAAWAYSVNS